LAADLRLRSIKKAKAVRPKMALALFKQMTPAQKELLVRKRNRYQRGDGKIKSMNIAYCTASPCSEVVAQPTPRVYLLETVTNCQGDVVASDYTVLTAGLS
jgi:hypothetical protein